MTLQPGFRDAGAPDAPVAITILPYDPESLRDSLTVEYGIPAPRYPDLLPWFLAYEAPEVADTGPVALGWLATRDSVERLADSLRGVDRRSAGYAGAYARFRSLYQRFTQRTTARNALHREATAEMRALAGRAGRAADSLRRWEDAAWEAYPEAAQAALEASGRDTVLLRVVDDAPLEVTLPAGHWWITATARVEGNPFLERRWHLGVVSAGFPFRVALSRANARTVWRH